MITDFKGPIPTLSLHFQEDCDYFTYKLYKTINFIKQHELGTHALYRAG